MGKATMWACRLVAPSTFEHITVPTPEARTLRMGEVLMRLLAGGICGSDLPLFRRGRAAVASFSDASPMPGAPMHEIVGEVLASNDDDIKPGTTVVGWASRGDGLAEYIVSDGDGLHEYNPALTPIEAVMLQPLACVLYAIDRLPQVRGASVAVIGLGPIGLLFAHVLNSCGARQVIGVDPIDRADVARQFGLDQAVRAMSRDWAASFMDGSTRPDIVVEAVGHQVGTLTDAVVAVAIGGCVYYFGIPDEPAYPFPMDQFLRKNVTMSAGWTIDGHRAALSKADRYVHENPQLRRIFITDVFSRGEVQGAFDLASRPARGRIKVVVNGME